MRKSTRYEIEHETIFGWTYFKSCNSQFIVQAREEFLHWAERLTPKKLRMVRVTTTREVVK